MVFMGAGCGLGDVRLMVFRMVGVLFFWGSSLIHGDADDINDIGWYNDTDMGYLVMGYLVMDIGKKYLRT
jgi:hypothetical protein